MKKVIGIIALLVFAGNIASAELLKNFKYDGKIEVNAFQRNNADYNENAADKRNDVDTRVQLNMGFDLTEDVDAVVSAVKADRQHGDNSQDANTALDNLFFEQAYLNLKGVLGFDHKLGRQYYGNEGDLIVYYGPQSWPFPTDNVAAFGNVLGVTGVDGYTGWYKYGKWDFHGVLAKETNTNAAADTDTDLFGLVAKYDLRDDLKLGGYVYRMNHQSGLVAGPSSHLDTIGVKANGDFMGFDYAAEIAKNMGLYNETLETAGYLTGVEQTGDFSGMAFKANLKYGMDLAGKIEFMGEYAMGSGDNDTTDDKVEAFMTPNSDYRPGIIWGGNHMAVGGNGLSNLTTFNLGAKWNPSMIEKLTLGAKFFNFAPTEKLAGTAKSYDTYGNELDVTAGWQHNESVGLKAYYAMFMPNKDYAQRNSLTASDDSTSVLGAAFTVKF